MTHILLQESLHAYLSVRNALDYPAQPTQPLLRKFIEYLEQQDSRTSIRAHEVIDWACGGSPVRSISTQHVRLSVARGFLLYLKASYPEIEIPQAGFIAARSRPMPYVFSTPELIKLLMAAEEIEGRCLHPQTLQTLIGLMACTGLRTGEVIKLNLSDVQLEGPHPLLSIHCSKFHKSRLVPLHATAVNKLRNYLQWRGELRRGRSVEAFFVAVHSGTVSSMKYQSLQRNFQDLLKRIGICAKSGQQRPTLHSLRHTFAVHRLRRWYEDGADVNSLIPNLAVYLGHINLSNSFWYLSATPELMGAAAQRFESYAENGGAV
jgi:integrase